MLFSLDSSAQYNVDRVITSGKAALYYEDYVLSIQYFNQVLALKPYLWEPWHLRAIAKFSLEDFKGAEDDVTHAISLNPYIPQAYDLRAVARIRQENYEGAIDDYNFAIIHDPSRKEYWHNRALCRLELKDYETAMHEVDSVIKRWERYVPSYLLMSDIMLKRTDTLEAERWVDKALAIEAFNPDAWRIKAYINLSNSKWKEADEAFSKVLHVKPKKVDCYLNRAVARLKLNNLRGAMADYDYALEFDPTNFLGHYNRGLLRQQVGDDNRAIEDFNFVLSLEPDNMMALFNRATLLDRTGDLKGAIRDYTKVIDEFPNFWTGLHYRAGCYRRLGMTAKAELDEFKILKAQMDKHLGKQPRWTRKKLSETRKQSEIDPEKYNQIVVADENSTEQEYKSEYRGKVQNRQVEMELQPYVVVSTMEYRNAVTTKKPFSAALDQINLRLSKLLSGTESKLPRMLYLSTLPHQLQEDQMTSMFALIDSLNTVISSQTDPVQTECLLYVRCAVNTIMQKYHEAISDAEMCMAVDSTAYLPVLQHAVCNARLAEFELKTQVANANLRIAGVVADFNKCIALAPDNAYAYYCLGSFYATQADYKSSIEALDKAIELDPSLPEAYYNRGLANLRYGNKEKGITDLGKAGELGLYDAYSVIKSYKLNC